MQKKIAAVAFDLDGTLYSNSRFYLRILPSVLRHWPLMLALGRVRKKLHGKRPGTAFPAGTAPDFEPDLFYDFQAALMAERLRKAPGEVRDMVERFVYRGWEPVFGRLPLFPHVRETLHAFRKAGLPLGLLSDFPPEKKLENFGIREMWDVVLCTERIGRLKPDPLPFRVLAEKLGLPPENILYVGNSLAYDVRGAKAAGMAAAWIRPWPFRGAASGGGPGRPAQGQADFVFSGYRQLSAFVLG